ncbi:MAG: hypothetical protein GY858_08755 [Candidatus Omnitrophica bacterium]|nr:hypothetical protein [Candidatus Omnitrophota bacterium]
MKRPEGDLFTNDFKCICGTAGLGKSNGLKISRTAVEKSFVQLHGGKCPAVSEGSIEGFLEKINSFNFDYMLFENDDGISHLNKMSESKGKDICGKLDNLYDGNITTRKANVVNPVMGTRPKRLGMLLMGNADAFTILFNFLQDPTYSNAMGLITRVQLRCCSFLSVMNEYKREEENYAPKDFAERTEEAAERVLPQDVIVDKLCSLFVDCYKWAKLNTNEVGVGPVLKLTTSANLLVERVAYVCKCASYDREDQLQKQKTTGQKHYEKAPGSMARIVANALKEAMQLVVGKHMLHLLANDMEWIPPLPFLSLCDVALGFISAFGSFAIKSFWSAALVQTYKGAKENSETVEKVRIWKNKEPIVPEEVAQGDNQRKKRKKKMNPNGEDFSETSSCDHASTSQAQRKIVLKSELTVFDLESIRREILMYPGYILPLSHAIFFMRTGRNFVKKGQILDAMCWLQGSGKDFSSEDFCGLVVVGKKEGAERKEIKEQCNSGENSVIFFAKMHPLLISEKCLKEHDLSREEYRCKYFETPVFCWHTNKEFYSVQGCVEQMETKVTNFRAGERERLKAIGKEEGYCPYKQKIRDFVRELRKLVQMQSLNLKSQDDVMDFLDGRIFFPFTSYLSCFDTL